MEVFSWNIRYSDLAHIDNERDIINLERETFIKDIEERESEWTERRNERKNAAKVYLKNFKLRMVVFSKKL